jgi:serine/threonine-protein kinase
MDKSEIKFIKEKEYKVIRELNRGGFGEALLIEDETINENFVCKKYSPYYAEDKEAYFKNFVQEIKLLHVLYHKNIVRVFNYYLYPEKHTGYILMEYVDGTDIQEYLKVNPDKINDVFIQTIQGFRHLEEFKILHRDIRPQNIMVNEGGTLKIIDFGFGKQIEFQNENFDKSISLNWRYTPPSEFNDHIYDFKTEIYFVGKLFEEIIRENGIESFGFTKVLNRMILSNYDSRITSFFDVDREVLSSKSSTIEFDQWDKRTYLEFADSLMKVYAKLYSNA